LRTERLVLHRWGSSDRDAFADLNADPETMEFFPAPLTREESDAFVDRLETGFDHRGVSMWAVHTHAGEFVGAVGLLQVPDVFPFGPTMEVGWRLARSAWGHGYATEAARRSMTWAFAVAGVPEIVSFTSTLNVRSRAVMERLGMHRDPAEDFDHPRIEVGDRLRRHVLYRIAATEWSQS
jgi:ribosomal-protein-alanine N-acetyltransferase